MSGGASRSEFVARSAPMAVTMLRLAGGDATAFAGLVGRLTLDVAYRGVRGRARRGGKAKTHDNVAAMALVAAGVAVFAVISAIGMPLALLATGGTYLAGSAVRHRANRRVQPRSDGPVRVRTHERRVPGGGTVQVSYHGRSKPK